MKQECDGYDRIILLGYSNGGWTVHKVAERLKEQGILVDFVVTVDPVNWPENIKGGGLLRKKFKKSDNVTHWVTLSESR